MGPGPPATEARSVSWTSQRKFERRTRNSHKELATPYEVRLTLFEGPLDLLLQLVENRELDITRVSLGLVTGQCLQHIRELPTVKVDELSEFLVIAAQLLLVKSRLLLPWPQACPPEPEQEEAGHSLLQQLRAYRRYKVAAQQLREREERGWRAFVRSSLPAFPPVPEGTVSPAELLSTLQRPLSLQPPAPPVSDVVSPITVSIADQISVVRERVGRSEPCYFRCLFSTASSRLEMIVTFLALLELVRLGEIVVWQDRTFGQILISSHCAQGAQVSSVGARSPEL